MSEQIRITRINGYAFRSSLETPVETSFGIMRDRPAVFLRVEDEDGAFGWGEVFANWPAAAAEHRVNLLSRDIGPLVFEQSISHPSDLFHYLSKRTHIVALQSGEWGPFRQVIAGLDIAMWDLCSRKSGQTLRRYMSSAAEDCIPAYASGIHINSAEALVNTARQTGFSNFKVKVGFNMENDLKLLNNIFAKKTDTEVFAADANQAWDVDTAQLFLNETASLPLAWLEEPIAADAPAVDWKKLNQASPYPLAGGENITGYNDFDIAIESKQLAIFQPDIIKWGGLTGCQTVGKKALAAGLRYCPHFLGGGIGLQASANLLAAVGGDGLLEVDVNPNPLRDAFGSVATQVTKTGWHCNTTPGLGITEIPEEIAPLQSHSIEITSSSSSLK